MNKNVKKVLFSLILCAIDNKEIEDNVKNLIENEEFLLSLYALAKSHDLAHLVAHALDRLGLIDKESDVGKKFLKQRAMAIFRCEQMLFELDNICKTLENAQIPFIPLKGAEIRQLYAEPWMRTSCDIDVLVSEENLQKAIYVLKEKLNFSTDEIKSSHDVALYSELGVHIELHFDLTEGDSKGRLKDVWRYATEKEGFIYCKNLPSNLFYLYHIKHMVKHFEAGGFGVKPLLDIHVMQNALSIRDKAIDLIKEEGLEKFENAVYNLSQVWFKGQSPDALSVDLENYILKGGVYGSVENRVLTQQVQKGGKFKYIMSRIFIPYSQLVIKYPSLKKCPILFPFYQVRRWFNLIFSKGRGKKSLSELEATKNVNPNQAKNQEALLDKLGL